MKKGKVWYRILSFALTVAILVGLCPQGVSIRSIHLTVPEAEASVNISNPRKVKDSSMESGQKVTWDCLYFGSYPQSEVTLQDGSIYNTLKNATRWDSNNDITISGTKYRRLRGKDVSCAYSGSSPAFYDWNEDYETYHYFKYEPIKWRVLSKEGNDAFLLADVVLDNQKYHAEFEDVTWEKSCIRSWLNGYGTSENQLKTDYTKKNFIDSAFSSAEKNVISATEVVNSDHDYYGTEGGKDTNDKVFFLSFREVFWDDSLASQYGFGKDVDDLTVFETFNEGRRSKCSTYAYAMGTEKYNNSAGIDRFEKLNGNVFWWLRTPGEDSSEAAKVNEYGEAYNHTSPSYSVDTEGGVRPALHLNLSSSAYSYAGTVCSDGTKSEVAAPDQPTDPEDELISNRLKYELKDTYSFENFSTQVDYRILRKFFNPIVSLSMYLGGEGIEGVCHGLAVSAMATTVYSAPQAKTYNKNQLYDVGMQDKSSSTKLSAKDYIKYAYISQMTDQAQKVKKNGIKDLEKVYKAVVGNILNDGTPVTLSIRGEVKEKDVITNREKSKDAGHTLWVIGIGRNNEDETELIVYDCNWPGEKRSVLLKKENGKYTGWEYTLWSGTTWGTGRKWAKLIAYDPSEDFVSQFEKVVGYTRAASEKSKLFISVDNENSSIVKNDNTKVMLSPDIDDKDFTYIEENNVLPGASYTGEKYRFWADLDNEVSFEAGNEQTQCSVASDESGIDLSVPKSTTAEISVLNKNDNKVKLSMDDTDDNKYEVTYNTVKQDEVVNQLTISGENAEQFEGNQTKEGIVIESDSLKNVQVDLSEVDTDGEVEPLVTKNISTDSNRILINNDEEKSEFTIKEDSNGDGKFDKNLVSVSYDKNQNNQKPSTDSKTETKSATQPSTTTKPTPTIKPYKATGASKQIAAGKKVNLKAEIGLSDTITKRIVWKSSNPKVATVNANGIVTVKKNTGGKKAVITATHNEAEVSISWKITSMKGIVKKVKITGAKTVKAGKSLKLKAAVTATKKANKKLQWTSSNTRYATVNNKGVVKTKKTAKGKTVKITATATDGSGKKATIKIKVK